MSNLYNEMFLENKFEEGLAKGEELGYTGTKLEEYAENYANEQFENSGD